MGKQLPDVNCQYGAPMGRANRIPYRYDPAPRSVRLFAVRRDSGGYDDGGAYWGARLAAVRLYCLTDGVDYREFIDARSRWHARTLSDLPMSALAKPAVDGRYTVTREWYGASKPGHIARFMDAWLGAYPTADEAWYACAEQYLARFGGDK